MRVLLSTISYILMNSANGLVLLGESLESELGYCISVAALFIILYLHFKVGESSGNRYTLADSELDVLPVDAVPSKL